MIADLILKTSDATVQKYILEHEHDDEKKLVLQHKEILDLPAAWMAQQIAGRRRIKSKLPLWWKTPGIIYPPTINLEQCSSEATARYKASLVNGKRGVDLTGGFGVDSLFLSEQRENITYVEPEVDLLEIVKHNHSLLGANHIEYYHGTAEEFIASTNKLFDFCLIDPSRRNRQQKVFKFADCIPNVVDICPALLERAEMILIKSSPLIDLQQGSTELEKVSEITVVSVDNECKEVLFVLRKNSKTEIPIAAVELDKTGKIISVFHFNFVEEQATRPDMSPPLGWLYEPNAAILKSGAFKLVASRYQLKKLHVNTHLYTNTTRLDTFPGRIFKVVTSEKLDKKIITHFPNGQANILTRNFPMSVEEIKKKTGLIEGGKLFLICTQSADKKEVLIAERMQ